MKPKRLIKSCELSSLDGVKELSFGKSSAAHRMATGDYSKKPRELKPREYSDEQARAERYGFPKL